MECLMQDCWISNLRWSGCRNILGGLEGIGGGLQFLGYRLEVRKDEVCWKGGIGANE